MPLNVSDFMTSPVITTHPQATVGEVFDLMLRHEISGLPVVEDAELVGIVTAPDLRDAEETDLVSDVMSPEVMTICPEDGLCDVAGLLADHDVRQLPVLDDDGGLVGIVSRANIVRAVGDMRNRDRVQQAVDGVTVAAQRVRQSRGGPRVQ